MINVNFYGSKTCTLKISDTTEGTAIPQSGRVRLIYQILHMLILRFVASVTDCCDPGTLDLRKTDGYKESNILYI